MNGDTPSPFEKFLGIAGAADDPVTLLALMPRSVSEGGVIMALQMQLAKVAAHPEGLTEEADEVRVALHAAAGRLLDKDRAADRRGAEPDKAAAANPALVARGNEALEREVLLTLAASGGWNKQSREKIAALAQVHGIAVEDAIRMAERAGAGAGGLPQAGARVAPVPRPIGRPLPSPISAVPGRAAPGQGLHPGLERPIDTRPLIVDDSNPFPHERDESAAAVKKLVVAGAVIFLSLAALLVVVVLFRSSPQPTGTPQAASTPAPTPASTPGTTAEMVPAPQRTASREAKPIVPSTRVGDWDDLLREAAAVTAALDEDASAAMVRFAALYDLMSAQWTAASPDGVVAGVDRLVEFVYRASQKGDRADAALRIITSATQPLTERKDVGAGDVSRTAWSAGVLARLAREKDLPATVRQRVQEGLAAAFPGASGPNETTFKSGAMAALAAFPQRMLATPGRSDDQVKAVVKAWSEWLAALGAAGGSQSPLYTRTVLLALDRILINEAEPTRDRAVFESIGALTVALPWRKEDESRRWLLGWFGSPGVSASDLYALTAALANRSGAEGVDMSMVLSASAGEPDRAAMRDRYATVWGLTAGESRDALLQRWAEAARAELNVDLESGWLAALEETLQASRYNRAAILLWRGDTGDVPDLLTPVTRAPSPPARFPRSRHEALEPSLNRQWLLKYREAGRNIPRRRELIGQIGGVPDVPIAEILVEEACRGSPAQVQSDARQEVIRYIGKPVVLNALLEFAPKMPITRANADLIEQATQVKMPTLRDPTWRVVARRALVETLTQALAGQSEFARVDIVAERLAELYTLRDPAAAASMDPDATPVAVTPLPLEVAAAKARLRWQREAERLVPTTREPFNLAQLSQRRAARQRLAMGRVQQFAAEQLAICELMAYVCVAEQAALAPEVAEVLETLEQQRREAGHIFEQLLATERTQLRLWLLRTREKNT